MSMIINKMAPLLQLALQYETLLTDELKESFIVDKTQNLWELIMEYEGDLERLRTDYELEAVYNLQGGFAQIILRKDQIGNLSNDPYALRLSLPTVMQYIDIGVGQICGSNLEQSTNGNSLDGARVLLGIIDSGIRYSHPDFITDEGTTRIAYLWDQTIGNTDNQIGRDGTIYTSEQINEALRNSEINQQIMVVPSQDTLGHGTALAGVAAGNGRGSANRQNRGVAPGCEMVIVKVGHGERNYPRDIDIMRGIDFVIEKAVELKRPMTILLGVGTNLEGHDGSAPLERYITRRYENWLLNFVVGTGNEGNKNTHTSGNLVTGQSQSIQISIEAPELREYGCCIWKKFSDVMSLVIQSPSGEETDELSLLTPNRAYLFDEVAVLINYSAPITSINQQVIYILFQAQGDTGIGSGLWTLTLTGTEIIEGNYHVWGTILTERQASRVRFLSPDVNQTLTIPSTAYAITKVGAYNGNTIQVANFSGRGFTADGRVAPDLVAPGVNITAPAISAETLYTTITGTSVAAAFVAGAFILLMEYGVYVLDDPNYYGEELRIYLLRTAQRPSSFAPYPNSSWGYGLICIRAALTYMKEIAENSDGRG